MHSVHALLCASVVTCGALAVHADDWTNMGGNAGRNGLSGEVGPVAPDPLWSGGRSSIIAWHPVILGRRLFVVRQIGFPPGGEPNGSPVVAYDLDSGAELWAFNIPFNTGDWTSWIAGARDGRVYVSRSGNGASVSAKMYALNAATGAQLWTSAASQDAGSYDGVVFADDGDLIVGSFRNIWRIDSVTGATVWVTSRLGSVSGNCGAAVFGDGVYICDAAAGGNVIKKYSLTTGAFQYQSPVLTGFLVQNSPFAGPDGTIYMHRVQNNVLTDFFYAIRDTGTALQIKWSVPAGYSTSTELGVGPDGSVYHWAPGNIIQRLNAATGAVINSSPVIPADFAAPRFAIDSDGIVFFSNGSFSNGRLYSFNPDLSLRWSAPVTNINIGGPSLGVEGTLVVAGVGNDLRAYRSTPVCCVDFNNDTEIDFSDIEGFLNALAAMTPGDCKPGADFNNDGEFDFSDIENFLAQYTSALTQGC